jgi:hypothetical protein
MAHNRNPRWDAGDTFFLTQQLQNIDPTQYYHLVPGVIGRQFIPAIPGVSPNLPVYKFKMIKMLGQTKKGSGHAKQQPTVSVVKTEETQNIKLLESAASWTIDEVRAANQAGEDLPQQEILDAVTQIEQQIDSTLALGDSLSGIPGLANNTNVGVTNATAVWSAATPDQILGDIANTIDATEQALKQGQIPGQTSTAMFNQWSLVLPNKYKTKLKTTRLGSTNDVTLAYFIKQNFDMIKDVKFWWRLDTANGGNPMGVLFPALDSGQMNPYAGGGLLPLDFERLPEQYDGRDVLVPCAGKCGGVVMRHPVGFRYLKTM